MPCAGVRDPPDASVRRLLLELLRVSALDRLQTRVSLHPTVVAVKACTGAPGTPAPSRDDGSWPEEQALTHVVNSLRRDLGATSTLREIVTSTDARDAPPLDALCMTAEPNYGSLWFWAKQSAAATVRDVLENMEDIVVDDLSRPEVLEAYLRALARRALGAKPVGAAGAEPAEKKRRGARNADYTAFTFGSVALSAAFLNLQGAPLPDGFRIVYGSDVLYV